MSVCCHMPAGGGSSLQYFPVGSMAKVSPLSTNGFEIKTLCAESLGLYSCSSWSNVGTHSLSK